MINRDELHSWLDDVMYKEGEKFIASVPFAKHLTDISEPLNDRYYIRHRVETVTRIRMTSKIDALALAKMVEEDYQSARQWSHYAAEELNHDILYLQDLRQHGWGESEVCAVKPFPSTESMVRFLHRSVHECGSLPAVAYSLFVEWNSARYSRGAVARAESRYSINHVKGAKAHVLIDDEHDHYTVSGSPLPLQKK